MNALCIYTSSDMVFDGSTELCTPDTPTSPLTIYGLSKSNAEQRLLSKCLVIRFPWIIGLDSPYFAHMCQSLLENKHLELFDNEFHSVVYIEDAIHLLIQLMLKALEDRKLCKQIWHIAGPRAVCRYELGEMIINQLKLDRNLISPISTKLVFKDVPRPGRVHLDSSRTFALLDFQSRSPEDSILTMLNKITNQK